jgi:hypothetical protein
MQSGNAARQQEKRAQDAGERAKDRCGLAAKHCRAPALRYAGPTGARPWVRAKLVRAAVPACGLENPAGASVGGAAPVLLILSIARAGSSTLLSLILGAFALGWVGYYYPSGLDWMLEFASQLKSVLTNPANTGFSAGYNIWLRFLIHEQTFVLMFFVLLMRLAMVLMGWSVRRLVRALPVSLRG